MKREILLRHEFVDYIPAHLEECTLYVSMAYATVAHKCCCGCESEVVTPLSPTDWSLTFDGRSISLDPSVGNWSFACQSHYWTRHSKVNWAPRWSRQEIAAGRARDRWVKEKYPSGEPLIADQTSADTGGSGEDKRAENFFQKLRRWFR